MASRITKRATRRNALLSVAAAAISLFFAAPAAAHPLGNFTINHLTVVHVARDAVRLRYVLDMAEIPSFQVMRENDIYGGDRSARLAAWASAQVPGLMRGLDVTVDGRRRPLNGVLRSVVTRSGAGGLPTIYLTTEFVAPLSSGAQPSAIVIHDATFPGRIGWKDIVLDTQDEPTHLLTAYPSALTGSPRDIATVQIHVAADGSMRAVARIDGAGSSPVVTASTIKSNALADMLARGASGPIALLTLLVAIGLGALHALEPGHGKTLLAVSLIGARATAAQALILAAALTFAHTAGVLALGLAMLAAAQWIVPEHVYPWITLLSGLLVVGLGAHALSRFIKSRRGAAHAHEHAHHHDHSHDIERHGHRHAIPGDGPLTFGSVVMIAMSGNIAPCPAALVVLLTAVTLHQVGYGLVVIIAFSLGLAAVLTGLGIALVRGAAVLSRFSAFDRLVAWGPLASATVIAIIGAIMVGQGFADNPAVRAPALLVTLLTLCAVAGYALSPGHSHTKRPAGAGPTTVRI